MRIEVSVVAFLAIVFMSARASPPRVEDIQNALGKIGFGSCNDQGMEQPLWPIISKYKPDMWIWMGDNIYGDIRQKDESKQYFPPKLFHEALPEVLRRRYAKQLNHPEYNAFVQQTPMIGIWDDHDFGINDGSKAYTYRKESQQIFLDYFNEPVDSPRRKQEGVYASYTVGSGSKMVKFILVDNRYHRDDYKQHDGDFLGDVQWNWLEKELVNSTAAFNVIVSGIQILPADRFFGAESWSRFPHQRERLLELILNSNAKGVILLSGDVHFAEINQVVCGQDQKQVITEVTSSGMTHSWMQFHFPQIKFFPGLIFLFANLILSWEFRPTLDSHYGYINWGMIEIDWDAEPVPVAHVRVRGRDEQVKLEANINSTKISSTNAAADAAACKAPRQISNMERKFRQYAIIATLALLFGSFLFNVVVLFWLLKYFISKALGRKEQQITDKKTN